jgi:hypothetical protein
LLFGPRPKPEHHYTYSHDKKSEAGPVPLDRPWHNPSPTLIS